MILSGDFMQSQLTIKIDTKALTSFLLVLILHFITITLSRWKKPADDAFNFSQPNKALQVYVEPTPMPKVRTLGKKDGSKNNDVLITPKSKPSPMVKDPFRAAQMQNPWHKTKPQPEQKTVKTESSYRGLQKPSARPSAMKQLYARPHSIQEAAQDTASQAFTGLVQTSPTLSKTDVNVHVEVPEGVPQDELNEFELMFYSFQKRMMEKYIGSIILQVREFEKHYPRKSLFPEGKHVMTGRVTFDSEGNIMQIKMVRWSQVPELQNLFEESLKSMNRLPNPPKVLWSKSGEMVVFYTFIVNNL
jgi:hypothetical protein